jgi:hypothetical protein
MLESGHDVIGTLSCHVHTGLGFAGKDWGSVSDNHYRGTAHNQYHGRIPHVEKRPCPTALSLLFGLAWELVIWKMTVEIPLRIKVLAMDLSDFDELGGAQEVTSWLPV